MSAFRASSRWPIHAMGGSTVIIAANRPQATATVINTCATIASMTGWRGVNG